MTTHPYPQPAERLDPAPAAPEAPTHDVGAVMQIIERAATDPNVDIDKMERLLDMQERLFNRQAETEFNRGMAAMQAELPAVTRAGSIEVKGVERSKFARFEDIVDVARPILQKHGFAVSFRVDHADHGIKVTGILMHQAGHRESTTMLLPYDQSGSKNNVQAMGSSVSYGKRYVLSALLNIVTRGEDDDGESALPVKRVSPTQAAQLKAMLARSSDTLQEWFDINYGNPDDVPERDFEAIKGQLSKTIFDDWVERAEGAKDTATLETVWTEGLAAIRATGDLQSYHDFKDAVRDRGKALKGGEA